MKRIITADREKSMWVSERVWKRANVSGSAPRIAGALPSTWK